MIVFLKKCDALRIPIMLGCMLIMLGFVLMLLVSPKAIPSNPEIQEAIPAAGNYRNLLAILGWHHIHTTHTQYLYLCEYIYIYMYTVCIYKIWQAPGSQSLAKQGEAPTCLTMFRRSWKWDKHWPVLVKLSCKKCPAGLYPKP